MNQHVDSVIRILCQLLEGWGRLLRLVDNLIVKHGRLLGACPDVFMLTLCNIIAVQLSCRILH
jgi:hypothetical protein